MANNPTSSILLKRSGVAGSVPTTASLQVGELALNTNDGKVFLHKSGSQGDTVVELIVAGATNTGSISVTGAVSASIVSASTFIGSGGAAHTAHSTCWQYLYLLMPKVYTLYISN